jgi:proline iminopeptidase
MAAEARHESEAAAHVRPEGQGRLSMKVDVAGAALNLSVRGQGPVCLVPSSMGAAPYERQLPEALARKLTLAIVDLRGSGFDVAAQDFEAVRCQLGAPKLAVLGHSVLGSLAIEYARRHPDRVSHVITAGTPPSGDMIALLASSRAYFEAEASPERKQLLLANMSRLTPASSMDEAMYAQTPMRFFDPTIDARPLFEGAVARPEIIGHLMGKLAPGWNIATGPPLRVPLLITAGRHDYVVPWRLWQPVLPGLPTATFHLFERSGHQPFCEEPAEFTDVVTRWMGLA